ncbi:MAG TPA: alkaline phosphatase PhoX [Burkholderiales bacterium]|nr:alkaline phosphatase PhoX [Burkholderiales bacterium]
MNHHEELVESVRTALKEGESNQSIGRRSFLKSSIALAAAALPLEFLSKGGIFPQAFAATNPYGPLSNTVDGSTGRTYLKLPQGFSYFSYGAAGSKMDDGRTTPGSHDGMGVCRVEDDMIYLVRNHEVRSQSGAYAGTGFQPTYDSRASGGTTTLRFDALRERWDGSHASLAGTITNCAGGVTPWGSWLSCEEETTKYRLNHGYVFEVPTDGTAATAKPIVEMGRFMHEAAAVVNNPDSAEHGWVYMTEDRGSDTSAGFYRFRPNTYGNLAAGGSLQMLKIKGIKATVVMHRQTAKQWDVEWVTIPNPQNTGVFGRGKNLGGATFRKLEGAWYGRAEHALWFVSSSTGSKGIGRIYKLDIAQQRLHMVYEATNAGVMEFPDNLTVTTDGSVLVCEDRWGRNPRLHMMSADGLNVFPLVEHNGSSTEFAGATFHGKWLFLNSLSPGLTFAITGPWQNGTL